jgi:hypothetical protein
MSRDTRWEHVWASVGPPQGYVDDGEGHEGLWQNLVEFFVEVRTRKTVYYSRILVHKDELEVSYKFMLDKMVSQIDDYIREESRVRTLG